MVVGGVVIGVDTGVGGHWVGWTLVGDEYDHDTAPVWIVARAIDSDHR